MLPAKLYSLLVERGIYHMYRTMLRISYGVRVARASLRGDTDEYRRRLIVWKMMPHSFVGSSGLEATYDAAISSAKVSDGAFAELGVGTGGAAGVLGLVANRHQLPRDVWLFDSFQGLPDPTKQDFDPETGLTGSHLRGLGEGSCLGTFETVSRLLFDKIQLDRNRIHLVKGWFEDTIPARSSEIGPIALLRIDADWYDSVTVCLDNLYDQVDPGGAVIIDDYGTTYGARTALYDFFTRRRIAPKLTHDKRGGVVFTKA